MPTSTENAMGRMRALRERLIRVPWHSGVHLTPEEVQVVLLACLHDSNPSPVHMEADMRFLATAEGLTVPED